MSKDSDRDVVPTDNGRWAVRAPHADRASGVFDRQSDAIDRGREIVGKRRRRRASDPRSRWTDP